MLYLMEENENQIKYACKCGKTGTIAKRRVKLNKSEDAYLLTFIIKCDNCREVHESIMRKNDRGIDINNKIQEISIREEEEKKVIQEKRRRHQDHILTTGCNLHGYKIIEYKGLVGGEITLGTGIISAISSEIADFSGGESNTYTKKIESAKKLATNRMIEASVEADGNAIIAIDIDINVFNKDIIGVSVNGTSVVIEKIDL